MINLNIKYCDSVVVDENNTAKAIGSGGLNVFATPAMIALMEKTACKSVETYLDKGMGTVGISINVRHISATPLEMVIYCESVLTEIHGNRLVFVIKVFDDMGLVGEGVHERFIVNNEKFLCRAREKRWA